MSRKPALADVLVLLGLILILVGVAWYAPPAAAVVVGLIVLGIGLFGSYRA